MAAMARRCGFAEREVARIRLATDEAFTNAVAHSGEVGAEVRVSCCALGTALRVSVHDRGPWFSLADVEAPDLEAPLEKRRIGGLGVHLMRSLMDEVEVVAEAGGKAVVMVKHLGGEERSTHAD